MINITTFSFLHTHDRECITYILHEYNFILLSIKYTLNIISKDTH